MRSSAIREDNPEIVAARRRGVTVIRRAEMLAELMRLQYGIAIAGTHGKTTTTSLVGTMLTEAGLDPTVIVGGRLRVSGTGARLGKSIYLVAEADEFDRSFLRLAPILAVITTIDVDHLDTYRDLDDIRDAFAQFASSVPFFGQVITCLDDPNVQALLPRLAERRVVTYGFSPQADLTALDVRSEGAPAASPCVTRSSARSARSRCRCPDATTCRTPSPPSRWRSRSASTFRRSPRGSPPSPACTGASRGWAASGGAAVVDDYAHHPAEVAATLQAAREAFPGARVVAVFQPHLFSRTQQLATEFGRALLGADEAWVTDVYAAREEPIPGVGGELVVEAARASGHRNVRFCPDWRDLPAALGESLQPGDLLLTMGAGDVYKLGHSLAAGEDRGAPVGGAAAAGESRSRGGGE